MHRDLPWRLPEGELRDGALVRADDEGRRSPSPDPRASGTSEAPVEAVDRRVSELQHRRHEVDEAHLRRDDGGLEPGGGEDERHADDLVVEVGPVHVVRALDLRLVGVALAPRLAVVGDESDRSLFPQADVVERLEQPREERLGLALHRLVVARVQRLERDRVAGLDARDDVRLCLPPLLALGWRTPYGMWVVQLWNHRQNGAEPRSRSHSTAPSSRSLVPATFASAKPRKRYRSSKTKLPVS